MKLYVATALCIASLLAGFTGGWQVQGWRLGQQANAVAVGIGKATIRQLDRAAETTATLQKATDHAITQANARTQTQRRAAAAARAELDGLRHDLAAPGPASSDAPACAATADRARTLAELFGNCAADLESLAAKADRHASDAVTLHQAWPRTPATPTPTP